MNDHRRGLDNGAIIGDVASNRTTRADSDVVPDFDVADDFCARADVNVVAYCRKAGTFAFWERVAAYGNVLKNRTAFADFRRLRYKNPVEAVRRIKVIYAGVHWYGRAEVAINIVALELSLLFIQRRLRVEIIYKRLPENTRNRPDIHEGA